MRYILFLIAYSITPSLISQSQIDIGGGILVNRMVGDEKIEAFSIYGKRQKKIAFASQFNYIVSLAINRVKFSTRTNTDVDNVDSYIENIFSDPLRFSYSFFQSWYNFQSSYYSAIPKIGISMVLPLGNRLWFNPDFSVGVKFQFQEIHLHEHFVLLPISNPTLPLIDKGPYQGERNVKKLTLTSVPLYFDATIKYEITEFVAITFTPSFSYIFEKEVQPLYYQENKFSTYLLAGVSLQL